MVYVLGVNLKNNSKALYSIPKIYGIGCFLTKIMFNHLNLGLDLRTKDLTQNVLVKILKWVDKNKILVESSLKQKIISDITKLKSIKTYRGLRHAYNLPVRGQRTKTNASSSRRKSNRNAIKTKNDKKF
uniref:Ribosomal protein S13 n=1 Tax=Cryptomonas curvata TaxID=233186 RepID=A0A2P1G8I3_9CRYP|nr:ribosomal protein S13 [Cryptomonas curvata]AVM81243.1 ribosomal protein S13 [Cryptomonas curvata]